MVKKSVSLGPLGYSAAPRCGICKQLLNNPEKPSSVDCGGDCLRCMAEAGDPECGQAMRDNGIPFNDPNRHD